MVIGGKTRGGEAAAAAHSEASMAGYCGGRDRSRVSSTSSESLSDGQMTCGGWLSCCFCQRGKRRRKREPFQPTMERERHCFLFYATVEALCGSSTKARLLQWRRRRHRQQHSTHTGQAAFLQTRKELGKDDDAFDQSIFLAGPQISRHLRAF